MALLVFTLDIHKLSMLIANHPLVLSRPKSNDLSYNSDSQLLKLQKEYLSLGNRTKLAQEQFKNYSTELARHILERGLVRIR